MAARKPAPPAPAAPGAGEATAALIRATAAAVHTLAAGLGRAGTTHLHTLVVCGASPADAELLRQFLITRA